MISFTIFVLALPSVMVKSAGILNTPSLILPVSNTTTTNSSNAVYQCNGPMFGYNLDWRSCTEALSQIDTSSAIEKTYGPRFKGPFDVKLPKRYISLDGRCFLEFGLMPGKFSARASGRDIAAPVDFVIADCVRGTPSQGGVARDVGADNSLKISVQYYEPRVQCSGTVAPSLLPSCQNIVDTMPADKIMTTWGPEDDPLAHTKLPMTLFSLDRRCKLTITDDGRPDTFSRYQFWTAAVALVGICVRGEQVGLRKNLGMSDHLSMVVGPA